jgi:CubicO group peptidase (beta-lactamase class C family)
MKKLDVPGAGFALIDQGSVVYEGGIGVKQLGKSDRVDANTLFMAASNTKGMTTLLLAKLVDEKKLQWDEHVTKVYPDFKLADEAITQQIEIRHLICACTGCRGRISSGFSSTGSLNPIQPSPCSAACGRQVNSARFFNTAT